MNPIDKTTQLYKTASCQLYCKPHLRLGWQQQSTAIEIDAAFVGSAELVSGGSWRGPETHAFGIFTCFEHTSACGSCQWGQRQPLPHWIEVCRSCCTAVALQWQLWHNCVKHLV